MKDSAVENELAYQLDLAGIPYERQVLAIPGRKFRFDFAVLNYLIEVNGSTWVANTGHTSGRGLSRDYEKSNLAEVLGYHVLTFTTDMIYSGEALRIIESALHNAERGKNVNKNN